MLSSVVPRPFVPRAVTPRPAVLGELPRLRTTPDDEGNEEEFAPDVVVAAELGVLVMLELLTELHGVDVVLSALMSEVCETGCRAQPAACRAQSGAV